MLSIFHSFLNHSSAIATLLAGAVAWFVYHSQRKKGKQEAAATIYLEIRYADRGIREEFEKATDTNQIYFPSEKLSLISESWAKYMSLFSKDLTTDEWDKISDFYALARKFDEAQRHYASFFQKNEDQRRRIRADYYLEQIQSGISQQEIQDKMKNYDDQFLTSDLGYSPQRPVNDIKSAALSAQTLNILETTALKAIKRLAEIK